MQQGQLEVGTANFRIGLRRPTPKWKASPPHAVYRFRPPESIPSHHVRRTVPGAARAVRSVVRQAPATGVGTEPDPDRGDGSLLVGRRGQAGQGSAGHGTVLCGQSGVQHEHHTAVTGSSVGRCFLAAHLRLGESARDTPRIAVLAHICRFCRVGIAPASACRTYSGDAARKIDRSHLGKRLRLAVSTGSFPAVILLLCMS